MLAKSPNGDPCRHMHGDCRRRTSVVFVVSNNVMTVSSSPPGSSQSANGLSRPAASESYCRSLRRLKERQQLAAALVQRERRQRPAEGPRPLAGAGRGRRWARRPCAAGAAVVASLLVASSAGACRVHAVRRGSCGREASQEPCLHDWHAGAC